MVERDGNLTFQEMNTENLVNLNNETKVFNQDKKAENNDNEDLKKSKEELINNILNNLLKKLIPKSTNQREFVNLKEAEVKLICQIVIEIFKREGSLVDVTSPLYVCGDIHGQFYDLLRIFNCCGQPGSSPKSNYLFMGDYVDRGKQSLETICLLFIFKIKFPKNITLLRGNHESAAINKIYGFYDECKNRISLKAWKYFCDVFTFMPIVGLIENKIMCMHGGLGPELEKLKQIAKIRRPCEIPDEGIVCDLLWADPSDDEIVKKQDFAFNDRGISVLFGEKVVKKFLENNNLDLIVRGHQVVEEGYEFFADQSLVTVFSAPNYCGDFDNNGAIMFADEELICSFQILKPSSKVKKNNPKVKEKYVKSEKDGPSSPQKGNK